MDTRTIAVVIVALLLAGCSGGFGAAAGPEYDTNLTSEEMILDASDYPVGWQYHAEESPDHGAAYLSPNNETLVATAASIFPNQSAAQRRFVDLRERYPERNSYNMSDVDAVWWANVNEEYTLLVIHDSNAIGLVVAAGRSGFAFGPERNTAIEYAQALHDHWQNQTVSGA